LGPVKCLLSLKCLTHFGHFFYRTGSKCLNTPKTTLNLTHKSRKLAWDFKSQSQKIIISGLEPQNQIKLYHILTGNLVGYYPANLVCTKDLIYNRTKGKSKITFQCSSLAIQLHSASLVSAETTLTVIESYIGENTQTIAQEYARDGLSGNQTCSCVDKTRDTILRDKK